MLGSADLDAVANFVRMRFDARRDRIGCPLLVIHGGADPLIKLADQQPFLDAAPTALGTLKVWRMASTRSTTTRPKEPRSCATAFADRLDQAG